jgi:hypothetical protein
MEGFFGSLGHGAQVNIAGDECGSLSHRASRYVRERGGGTRGNKSPLVPPPGPVIFLCFQG